MEIHKSRRKRLFNCLLILFNDILNYESLIFRIFFLSFNNEIYNLLFLKEIGNRGGEIR